MYIETIETESLGNRGYLVHDGSVALAIDVQRDYERWLDAAAKANVTITHVFETHMHNDYVTGGFRLAESVDAAYVVPQHSGATFEAHVVSDSDMLPVGGLSVTGLHTPGHTEHHMSYLVSDGVTSAVFTGGGILYGTVGRTDLVSPEKTDALTHAQYDSAQRLGANLPDETAVFPTHGFGSFCSSADGSGAKESTMATEKESNVAFTVSREEFVRQIIAGLGPYPKYYAHMGPSNQAGPPDVKPLHIHAYAPEDIGQILGQQDAWVIDVRSRKLFATHHPEGAVGIELGKSFSTYLGWVVPWSDKLLLVGDTKEMLQDAHVELSRIGMDAFIDGATDDIPGYLKAGNESHYDVKTFSDLKEQNDEMPYILDVRFASDWNEAHVRGSHSVALHELTERMHEIPADQQVWVHCASGYRASIAASLLDRAGRKPVLINDDFSEAVRLGLTG